MIESFKESANNFKKELEYTIAYNYAIYDDGQENDLLTRMKNRIMLADRQFLDENLQKEADRAFVCPEKVLMDKVEEMINEFYDEFKLSNEIEKEFNEYGDYTLKFQNSVNEKIEVSRKRTVFDIQKELFMQINRASNVRDMIIAVRKTIDKRINSLEKTLSDISLQLDTDMLLCKYKSKGYKYFRTVTQGENCEDCSSKAGKITLIEDAVCGENKPPFHPNCDCSIEILDDDGKVVYTNAETKKSASALEKYFQTSLEQLILGNYTDDVNLLGTVLQMLAGIVGVDLPMDIRDLLYDVTNFKLTKEHVAQTILDAVALLPVVGGIKYVDEAGAVLKFGDKIVDTADVARKADKAIDVAKTLKRSTKGDELLSKVTNQKLRNAIKEMYRPGAKIGDGSLSDAIKYEIKTGKLVGGKSHITKGKERLKNLERILSKESMTKQEKDIAEKLIYNLRNALGGK